MKGIRVLVRMSGEEKFRLISRRIMRLSPDAETCDELIAFLHDFRRKKREFQEALDGLFFQHSPEYFGITDGSCQGA